MVAIVTGNLRAIVMITNYKKMQTWIIPVITIMAVIITGLITFLVIGLISRIIDNFFK